MPAFGIDLGTTNSVIAHLVDGQPRAIAIDGHLTVPSVVLYGEDGVQVGHGARNLALLHADRTIASVKRHMGRASAVHAAGKNLSPAQVSAEILGALKRGAEATTGETVKEVVITVPAYFDNDQRTATLQAAEIAGMSVLQLINEPTAASLVYEQLGDLSTEPHVVLVYDLGGGTFDVSVLDIFGDVREVKSTCGDTHLGGDDFDRLLVNHFCQHLLEKAKVDVRTDPVAMARLTRLAEETKIALSADAAVPVRAEFLTTSRGKPVHLEMQVRRSEFQALILPQLERTLELTRQALQDAKVAPEDLARICLVGGSTRIPLVRELLSAQYSAEIHEEIDPDLAVALGAALQAGLLAGEPVERILVDVTAHDLGVAVMDESSWRGDAFAPIIHRNTVLPTRRENEFYTAHDNQAQVLIEVFQGNSPFCSGNRLVGSFEFKLQPGPEGTVVTCALHYDTSGVVQVTVAQAGTSLQHSVEMRVASKGAEVETETVEVADAPEVSVASSAVLRKATELATRLEGKQLEQLNALMQAYMAQSDSGRDAAEEALLDFFVELDDANA